MSMVDDYEVQYRNGQPVFIRRFFHGVDELQGEVEVYASGKITGATKLHGKYVTILCRGDDGTIYLTKKERRRGQIGEWIKVVHKHVERDRIYCNQHAKMKLTFRCRVPSLCAFRVDTTDVATFHREYETKHAFHIESSRKIAKAKYASGSQGKVAQAKYATSSQGKARQAKYVASPQGKATQAKYVASPQVKEL